MREKGGNSSDPTDIWQEAEALFQKMRPMILRLASRMLKIDSTLDQEDLLLQARLALREACLKYEREHLSISRKKTAMKRETFAYWYLQKFFQQAIDADRVLYDVFDQEGNPLTSLYGGEYTRNKKRIPGKHSFRSRTVFSDPAFFKDRDGKNRNADALPDITPERTEDEEDIQLTLSRIYNRICRDDE